MAGSMRHVIRSVFTLSLIVCQILSLARLGHENNINGFLLGVLEALLLSTFFVKISNPAWDIIYESALGALWGILTAAVDDFSGDRAFPGVSGDREADDTLVDSASDSFITELALFVEPFQAVIVLGLLLPKIGVEAVKMFQKWEVNDRFHSLLDFYGNIVILISLPVFVCVLFLLLYLVRPWVLVFPLALLLYLVSFILGWVLCYAVITFHYENNTIFFFTMTALMWNLGWQLTRISRAESWSYLPGIFTTLPFHLLRRETAAIIPSKESWSNAISNMTSSCVWCHVVCFMVTYVITGLVTWRKHWLITDCLLGCIELFVIGILVSEHRELGKWPSAVGLLVLVIFYPCAIRNVQNSFLMDDLVLTVCMYMAWTRNERSLHVAKRNYTPLKTISTLRY